MKIDILQLLSEKDALQTQISDKLHMNAATTQDCLRVLRKKELISKAGWIYSITRMGRELAENAARLEEKLQ